MFTGTEIQKFNQDQEILNNLGEDVTLLPHHFQTLIELLLLDEPERSYRIRQYDKEPHSLDTFRMGYLYDILREDGEDLNSSEINGIQLNLITYPDDVAALEGGKATSKLFGSIDRGRSQSGFLRISPMNTEDALCGEVIAHGKGGHCLVSQRSTCQELVSVGDPLSKSAEGHTYKGDMDAQMQIANFIKSLEVYDLDLLRKINEFVASSIDGVDPKVEDGNRTYVRPILELFGGDSPKIKLIKTRYIADYDDISVHVRRAENVGEGNIIVPELLIDVALFDATAESYKENLELVLAIMEGLTMDTIDSMLLLAKVSARNQ